MCPKMHIVKIVNHCQKLTRVQEYIYDLYVKELYECLVLIMV